jgi:hypothetical protein
MEWSQKPEVKDAWKTLKKQYGLNDDGLSEAKVMDNFGLIDGETLGGVG